MKLIITLLTLISLTACSGNDQYASQQVAWDNMSYVDSYEKLNSNMMMDLSSKIK